MNTPFCKVSSKNIHMQVCYLTRISFNSYFKSQHAVQPEKCNALKTQLQFYRRQCFCIYNIHINCLVVLFLILTNSRVGAFFVDHDNQSDWYTPVLKNIIKCIQCEETRNDYNDRNDNNSSLSTSSGSSSGSSNTNTKIIKDKLYVTTYTTILSVPITAINAKKPNQIQKVNKSESFINYTYDRNSNISKDFVKQQNNSQYHQPQFQQWIYKHKHNNALFELISCLLVAIFLELLPLILHRLHELILLLWELIQRHISLNGHCRACFCHTCANALKITNYCIVMQPFWNYQQQTIYFKQQKNGTIMPEALTILKQQQHQKEHCILNKQKTQLHFFDLISVTYETIPIVTGSKQVTSEHIFISPNMCINYYKNHSCCVVLLYNVFNNIFINQLLQNVKRHNLCRNMPQEQREYHDKNDVDSMKKQTLLDLKKTLLNHKWLILLGNIYKKQYQLKQNSKGLNKKFMLTLPYNKIIKMYGKILYNKNRLLNTSKNKNIQQKHQTVFTDTTYRIITKNYNKNINRKINNSLRDSYNKNISNSKYSFHRNFLYERNFSWCCCCYPSKVDDRRLLYSCESCAYICCCYCYYVCPYYKHCKCQNNLYCCYSDCCLYNSYKYDKLNNIYGIRKGAEQQYQQKNMQHNSPSVNWSKTSFQEQKHFCIYYGKYFSNCCCCCFYFHTQSQKTNSQQHKSDRILIDNETTSCAKLVSTTASTQAKMKNKNKPFTTAISISSMKQKLLKHFLHLTCYCLQQHLLTTLLRVTVFPQNKPQYPQQQQNVAHFHSTIVSTNSHNFNSANQYCIAYNNNTIVTNNRQQWQKGQSCKLFYNNRKRQRGRRRRRRRRRRIDDQSQQQQELQMSSKSKVHLKENDKFYELQHFQIIQNQSNNLSIIQNQLQQQSKQHQQFHWCMKVNEMKKIIRLLNAYKTIRKNNMLNIKTSTTYTLITSAAIAATTTTPIHSFSTPISTSTRIYRRHTKPNLVWLFIGLVCFDGPKLVNSNIINHHQEQQQQQNRQQNGHQQKPEGTKSIHIPNMNSTTIFKEYKIDYKNNDVTNASKIILGDKSKRSEFKIYYNNSRIDYNDNNNITHKHSNNKKLDNSNQFILIYTKRIHSKNEIYNNTNNSKNNNNNYINNNNNNNKNNNINNNNNNINNNNSNNNNTNNNNIINNKSNHNINTNNYIRNCTNMAYHQNYQHRQLSQERRQRETNNAFSIFETVKSDIDKFTSGTNENNGINESVTTDVPWYDLFYASEQENSAQNDRVRLESIKLQILSKLGLTRKPNISQPLPKQFVWDTIYRAEGIHNINDFQSHFHNHHQYNKQNHQYQKHMHSSYVHSINNDQENKKIPYNKHKHRSYRNMKDYYDINNIKTLSKYSKENKKYNKQSIAKMRNQFIQNTDQNKNDDDLYTNVSILNLVKESTDLYNNDLAYISNQTASRNFHEDEHTYKTLHITKQQKYKIESTVSPLMPIPTDIYSVINVKKYFLYDHEQSHNVPLEANIEEKDFEELQGDDYFGSTKEIITFGEQGYMYNQHHLVEFSPQQQRNANDKLYIHSAEIHIRIDKLSKPDNTNAHRKNKRDKSKLKIWIFKLNNNNFTQERFDQISKLCAVFNVNTQRLGWQKFDLTQTVREWYEHDNFSKLRLLIDCTGCERAYNLHLFDETSFQITAIKQKKETVKFKSQNPNNMKVVNRTANIKKQSEKRSNKLKSQNKHRQKSTLKEKKNAYTMYNTQYTKQGNLNNPYRPFLVLHTETRKVRRVRRRAIDCIGAQQGQCCKESFYVSFKALGWDDWIIAPRGYFANYCRGDCTGPYRTPDTFQTFHAHFIEEYRKMGLLNGMQPCCAPVKFSSMSLIYYGNDGIIKRDLPKMVVDECGCP